MSEPELPDDQVDEVREAMDTVEAILTGMSLPEKLTILSHLMARICIAGGIPRDGLIKGAGTAYDIVAERKVH